MSLNLEIGRLTHLGPATLYSSGKQQNVNLNANRQKNIHFRFY